MGRWTRRRGQGQELEMSLCDVRRESQPRSSASVPRRTFGTSFSPTSAPKTCCGPFFLKLAAAGKGVPAGPGEHAQRLTSWCKVFLCQLELQLPTRPANKGVAGSTEVKYVCDTLGAEDSNCLLEGHRPWSRELGSVLGKRARGHFRAAW